ncbi:hypothetical protein AWH48_20020 [Domibacillus aminovorans]|uniref:Uncharacterized protein n=1 Tax=Domibacillus aminovorans TaxID=29332 RepID=A0A177KTG1_9BACI|nr:hypothetical protein AWH48_20020 [Domibacillus aminovorans]
MLKKKTNHLDYEELLQEIKSDLKEAPAFKQESMNRCLCEIGIHFPEYMETCIDIGERIGRLDDKLVPKGCTSTFAPEWIAAGLKRMKK